MADRIFDITFHIMIGGIAFLIWATILISFIYAGIKKHIYKKWPPKSVDDEIDNEERCEKIAKLICAPLGIATLAWIIDVAVFLISAGIRLIV